MDRFRFPETFTLDDDGVEKSSIKTVPVLLLAEHFERRKINLFSSAPDMKASRIFFYDFSFPLKVRRFAMKTNTK